MPPITENVIIAGLSLFGVVLTGLLTYLGIVATSARRHAKATRYEVQNSHETNLRDDLDDKFTGLEGLVRELIRDMGGMKSDIRGIRREAAVDRADLAAERQHIRELEATVPRVARRRTPKPKETE